MTPLPRRRVAVPERVGIRRIEYNVGDGKDKAKRRDLRRMIRRHQPDIIALVEIADRHVVLEQVAKATGYRFVCDTTQDGAGRIGFLIAPWVRYEGHALRRLNRRRYVGRRTAGAKRTGYTAPKFILSVRVTVRGCRRVEGVTHLVPSAAVKGNVRTKLLHAQQVAGCALWLRTRRRPACLSGDFNATWASRLLRALFVVAVGFTDPHGTRGPRSIDWHVTPKKGAPKRRRVTVTALTGYSSDHRPLMMDDTTHR